MDRPARPGRDEQTKLCLAATQSKLDRTLGELLLKRKAKLLKLEKWQANEIQTIIESNLDYRGRYEIKQVKDLLFNSQTLLNLLYASQFLRNSMVNVHLWLSNG